MEERSELLCNHAEAETWSSMHSCPSVTNLIDCEKAAAEGLFEFDIADR
jgi:hypothetical protein